MCSVSTPKPDQSAVASAQQKPQYLRNPWLDGLSIQGAGESTGRNSLVIGRGTQAPSPATNAPITSPPIWNMPTTNLGIGSGGGFSGGGFSGGGSSGTPSLGIKMR